MTLQEFMADLVAERSEQLRRLKIFTDALIIFYGEDIEIDPDVFKKMGYEKLQSFSKERLLRQYTNNDAIFQNFLEMDMKK